MKSSIRIFCFTLSIVTYCVAPGSIGARTWRVTPDGTGDAPSIEAAMDSAAAFDTVLVAPGEHAIAQVFLTDGVSLIGEDGPLQTRLVPDANAIVRRLACSLLSRPTQISGLWLDGFFLDAIFVAQCVDITVSECVFTNNGTGIVVDSDFGRIQIANGTFVDNTIAIDVYSGAVTCRHNIIWGPARGLQGTVVCNDVLRLEDVPLLWRPGNFSQDPQFCAAGDYRITASSPCAPGNAPLSNPCGLIGALPVNCAASAVEERTWGQVKALYRE